MQQASDSHTDLNTVRDSVESVWIAIVLAFVLRAFFVEAFVIPTGSMAPRLMGEHWDLQCPNCSFEYPYGYPQAARGDSRQPRRGDALTPSDAQCPNCGFAFASGPPEVRKDFVNAGDRVLVMKYLYDFMPPQPWDVVVFRNPQNNQENYIKRLIGLPGETIEIVHGDIFYIPPGDDGKWRIRRKPLKAQEAMWQVVYDNDYRPLKDAAKQWSDKASPDRWDLTASGATLGGRRLVFKGEGSGELALEASEDDFLPVYGYNSPEGERKQIDEHTDIVSDLKLMATFVPKAPTSALWLHLSSLEHRFQANVKADGTFTVSHSAALEGDVWDSWTAPGSKVPALSLDRGHVVALVHVDFQVQLWIDGDCVFTSSDDQYAADHDALAERISQVRSAGPDHKPLPMPMVRIGGDGGPFDLLHVRLMRDVYYTEARGRLDSPPDGPLGEFARQLGVSRDTKAWGVMGNPIRLGDDSFFVLGDNSPQSLDGRAWTSAAPTLKLWKNPREDHARKPPGENELDQLYQLGTVPRYNMIGKALFVYWPSGLRAPGLEFLPVVPNVGKMRLIR